MKAFQKAKGLAQTGIADDITQDALYGRMTEAIEVYDDEYINITFKGIEFKYNQPILIIMNKTSKDLSIKLDNMAYINNSSVVCSNVMTGIKVISHGKLTFLGTPYCWMKLGDFCKAYNEKTMKSFRMDFKIYDATVGYKENSIKEFGTWIKDATFIVDCDIDLSKVTH